MSVNEFDDIRVFVKRSRRKTISVEIERDLSVLVRAPLHMPESEIRKFLLDHESWIRNHRKLAEQRQKETEGIPRLTMDEIRELAEKAMEDIPERVRHFAPIVGVTYGRITIRNQRSRWGSCTSRGNLNFNCLLMLAPDEHRDYVVVHELCHRKHMDHSKEFWAEVERVLPDYRESVRWFKENGDALMHRMVV
ncbi:MAG: M48 family metallopeptidase [Lachnospiraceae bacterium]|nr:M48 family metallopeptidase [Lachnospiraceae bacterium]